MRDSSNLILRFLSIAAFIAGGMTAQAFAEESHPRALSAAATSALEAPLNAADTENIAVLIKNHLKAFRHDDAAAVYRAASDHARTQYRTAGQFYSMMQASCHSLPSHVSYALMDQRTAGAKALQKIEFLNSDGTTSTGFYRLVKNTDGNWAVDGCLMLKSDAQPI